MPILIACSPSTGSSLLRRILNRHPDVFCGPETSLFAKKEFYQNWSRFKHTILKNKNTGLVNVGWHQIRGVNLKDENEISDNEIKELITSSNHFVDFADSYFDKLLNNAQKKMWIEKTPSNAFAIDDFLNLYKGGKVIHISRNPYDTIASLVNRGMSVFNAVCVYLLNTSQCLQHHNQSHYFFIKYENLVFNPKDVLEKLFDFLNIIYDQKVLEPGQNEKGTDHMKGWAYKETSAIGPKSIGRFEKLSEKDQALIISATQHVSSKLNTSVKTIKGICEVLDYDFINDKDKANKTYFDIERMKDILKRSLKKSSFGFSNYPITWSE